MGDLQRKNELRAAAVIAPSELDLVELACSVAEQQVAVARAAPPALRHLKCYCGRSLPH
jgi:hypothetical protein